MKEASGELNMTLVTILAVAAILAFVGIFVPRILGDVQERWDTDNQSTVVDDARDRAH